MIESKIDLIILREEMSLRMKRFKTLGNDRINFENYCKALKEYQRINHELFTFEMFEYLNQFEIGTILYECDDFTLEKGRSSFLGQGIRFIKGPNND